MSKSKRNPLTAGKLPFVYTSHGMRWSAAPEILTALGLKPRARVRPTKLREIIDHQLSATDTIQAPRLG